MDVVFNNFPYPLSTYFCKFMCPVKCIYSLFVPTLASRIQSSFDDIFHISLAGIEMAALATFSAHICVNGETDHKPFCKPPVPTVFCWRGDSNLGFQFVELQCYHRAKYAHCQFYYPYQFCINFHCYFFYQT